MKIVKPSIDICFFDADAQYGPEQFIERVARTCYKSEDRVTDDSATKFVEMLRNRGHHAMLEFGYAVAFIVGDRGLSHELVRHRLASFAQESTRYCNYGKGKFGGEITVIEQPGLSGAASAPNEDGIVPLIADSNGEIWAKAMEDAEKAYLRLLEGKVPPQIARSVLPIGLKTEIVIGANLREWRHIFEMRCAKAAHPIIRGVMLEALRKFNDHIPAVYGDLAEKFLEGQEAPQ